MDSSEKNSNQRKSFRCPVPGDRQAAVLKVGRRRYSVQLFNESAGGLAAWSARDVGAKVNDVVLLQTAMGMFEVRIAYVQEINRSEIAGSQGRPMFRLGLERVCDLNDPNHWRANSRGALGRSSMSTTMIGSLLIVAIVTSAVSVLAARDDALVRYFATPRQNVSSARRAERASPAAVPEEAELTDAQQKRIEAVAATVADALDELDAAWADDPPQERARKQALVADALRREVLDLLTRRSPQP